MHNGQLLKKGSASYVSAVLTSYFLFYVRPLMDFPHSLSYVYFSQILKFDILYCAAGVWMSRVLSNHFHICLSFISRRHLILIKLQKNRFEYCALHYWLRTLATDLLSMKFIED
jgi:hypothetical protein